jgi:hypothetical protein
MKASLERIMTENFLEANNAMIALKKIVDAKMATEPALTAAQFGDIRVQENIWSEAMGRYVLAAKQHRGLTITKRMPVI